MLRHAISHARLMRVSTDRVQAALDSADTAEQAVAVRVLENPDIWDRWEREHSSLMRRLADCGARAQIEELKRATFRLLHGKALFDYLRDNRIRGRQRQRIVAHFRPGRSYEAALVSEHGEYLRKACSFICTSHLGSAIVQDPAFLDPLHRYEELYTEYFEMYCASLIGPGDEAEAKSALLPLLKYQLHEQRLAILDPKAAQSFLKREADLRRATGETQRLRSLVIRPR